MNIRMWTKNIHTYIYLSVYEYKNVCMYVYMYTCIIGWHDNSTHEESSSWWPSGLPTRHSAL